MLGNGSTMHEGISCHTRGTTAHWNVIEHLAYRILATGSRARINAFVSDTSLIAWTVGIQDTFRPTSTVWIALIFW